MASDTGTCFTLFLFDLSATFDTVDHKVLLNKFKVLAGISSSTFDWFPFYLSTRTFSVRTKKLSLNITLWGFHNESSFSRHFVHVSDDGIQLYMPFKAQSWIGGPP